MKKSAVLLTFIVLCTVAHSQDSTKISSPVIETKKRNELSLNTAPVFRTLLGSSSADATRFSMTYKRNLSCKSALRISIMADLINNTQFYNPYNEVIILKTDSVMIKQVLVAPGYVSPHINLGYERLFGKHKLKWFYGTDLLIGYAENESFLENKVLRRDWNQSSGAWVEDQTLQADIVSKSEKKIFSLGISPFFGAKYPISKRFSLSAQVSFDMAYRRENITSTSGNSVDNFKVSTFDFSTATGILNDISLVYKF